MAWPGFRRNEQNKTGTRDSLMTGIKRSYNNFVMFVQINKCSVGYVSGVKRDV